MAKPALKVVDPPVVEPAIDWENREMYVAPRYIPPESMMEEEWYARQAEMDRKRRPVDPPEPVKPKSRKAVQMEMFRQDNEQVFQSDMKFKKLEFEPGKEGESMIAKIILTVDLPTGSLHEVVEPLFKMQNRYVDVLIGGSSVTTKEL